MNGIVKYLRNHTGSTLMLTLITFAVLAILGMAILAVSSSHLKMTTAERDYQAVYYIAEAGLNQRLSEIKAEITKIYGETTSEIDFFQQFDNYINIPVDPVDSFDSVNGQQPIVRVEIDKSDTKYTIKSTGEIGNRQRTVMQTIELTWAPRSSGGNMLNDMTAFVNSTIRLTGGAKVIGNIGSNSDADNAIFGDGGAVVEGDIYHVGKKSSIVQIISTHTGDKKGDLAVREYVLPPFPTYPLNYEKPAVTEIAADQWNKYNIINSEGDLNCNSYIVAASNYVLDLDKDYQFRNILVSGNTILKINVGNVDRSIVVDHLNIASGDIKLLGTGKLTIYANKVSIGQGEINKGNAPQDDAKRLNIYIKGTTPAQTLAFGSGEIYGSIYAENANFELGQGKRLEGNLVTGGTSVNISGGSSANIKLIYAPNAAINVEGGANINGTLICNTLSAKGGATLNFGEFSLDEIPFFPEDGSWGSGGGASPSLEDLLNIGSTREL